MTLKPIVLRGALGLDPSCWFRKMRGPEQCLTLEAIACIVMRNGPAENDAEQEYHWGWCSQAWKDASPSDDGLGLMKEHLKTLTHALSNVTISRCKHRINARSAWRSTESPEGPNTINKRLGRTARINVTEHAGHPQKDATHSNVEQRLYQQIVRPRGCSGCYIC